MDAAVIVVGNGPAGMMLAGELRLAGVDVIVLAHHPEPTGGLPIPGLTVRTMEEFAQRGLLTRFDPLEASTRAFFGGLPLDLGALDSPHLPNKTTSQPQIEAILGEWATELGAHVRPGPYQVLAVTQDDDGVTVDVEGPRGTQRLRCRYLVGCDGRHSTVRAAADIPFPGTAATTELMMADVRGTAIDLRVSGNPVPGGVVGAYESGPGVTRLFLYERGRQPRERTEPPGFPEVAATWHRLTGEDVSSATALWTCAFGDETRQVTEYRRGRILLAGSGAHIEAPVGNLGIHAGIQDAVNLGWKLGAVVRGTAPERLLDTYHDERHPVGRRLLRNTQAHALLVLGGDDVEPLRDLLTELAGLEAVNVYLMRAMCGLDAQYDVGPGDHPLLGRRMPHRELVCEDTKTSTTELLRSARGVLLDGADDAGLRAAAAPWADRVDIATVAAHESGADASLAGADAVLIRPDGHVAWVSQSQDDLPTALERWFGAAGGAA